MPRSIFINLPVSDLDRAISFYRALGSTPEPRFSDETAACMVFSDTLYVMLLTPAKFASFTPRPTADARAATEVLLCLTIDGGRAAVDDLIERAGRAGGAADPAPPQDMGFMYSRSVEDPDGHIWELLWMDEDAAEAAHERT